MQEISKRRTNRERTEQTRTKLIAAARQLFTEKGYAETGTPEIVKAAGVTRGALYHHFDDKQALLRAVCEEEAADVAAAIENAAPESLPLRDALLQGGAAFLNAMAKPGRTRLLLVDGPAILGREDIDEIDARHGARTLREAIAHAASLQLMAADVPVDAVSALLSASFDRAALAIDAGGIEKDYLHALAAIIDGLIGPEVPAASVSAL